MSEFARYVATIALAASLSACAMSDVETSARFGPDVSSQFPKIKDLNSLVISREVKSLGLCMGLCVVYSVEIHGDGTIIYNSDFGALASGMHRARISQGAVRKLFERARKFEYQNFLGHNLYEALIPEDAYVVESSIAYDGRYVAFGGYELAEALDEVADTARWTSGNDRTAASLKAEGWDFSRVDETNLEMLVMGARTGNTKLVRAFLDEGFPVSGEAGAAGCRAITASIEGPNWARLEPSRSELSRELSRRDSIVQMLVAAGAPAQRKANKCDALIEAAYAGALGPVRSLLRTHPDVNAKDSAGDTALMKAAAAWVPENIDRTDYPGVIRMLMAAGARDKQQVTAALAKAAENRNAPLVRFLLTAGADPNVIAGHPSTGR